MTLAEAWSLWLDGQLSPNQLLWGLELFWWERLGKAMQLVAGATILVEIIGAPALRRFAGAILGRVNIAGFESVVRDHFNWLGKFWRYFFLAKSGSEEEKKLLAEYQAYKADTIGFLLGVAICILGSRYVDFGEPTWLRFIIGMVALLVMTVFVGPLLVLVAILLFSGLGALFAVAVVGPIAWLLERERLDRWVKLFAFLLLVAGFHFDFLAS